jgi:hypothetical protein
MRRIVLVSLVSSMLLVSANGASACSCAIGDPRDRLAEVDAAFVGTLVEKKVLESTRTVNTFRVEEALKGELGETVDVHSGSACGLEVRKRATVGIFLTQSAGSWRSGLCDQVDPDDLRAAAAPPPEPQGTGPIAMLVGGSFGDARVLAVDIAGRTVGYGRGNGAVFYLSVCPGSQRAVEIVDGERLAVRNLGSLHVERERALPFGRLRKPVAVLCRDRAAGDVLVFSTNHKEPERSARLLHVTPSGVRTLWKGTALGAWLGRCSAYLVTGTSPNEIVRLDFDSGRTRLLRSVPRGIYGSLAPSPDGTMLAAVAPSRVVLLDLNARPARVRTVRSGAGAAEVVWIDDGRLAWLPKDGEDADARVYDTDLRPLSRFGGWGAADSVLLGHDAFGLGPLGEVLTAPLPHGPVRAVQRLPSPEVYVIVALPPVAREASGVEARTSPVTGRRGSAPVALTVGVGTVLAAVAITFAGARARRRGSPSVASPAARADRRGPGGRGRPRAR